MLRWHRKSRLNDGCIHKRMWATFCVVLAVVRSSSTFDSRKFMSFFFFISIAITELNLCACEKSSRMAAAGLPLLFSFAPMRHAVRRILVEAAAPPRSLSFSARAFSNSGCRLEQFHRVDEAVRLQYFATLRRPFLILTP
jgi:hypothetical protein